MYSPWECKRNQDERRYFSAFIYDISYAMGHSYNSAQLLLFSPYITRVCNNKNSNNNITTGFICLQDILIWDINNTEIAEKL
jgi:hypothetical protein